MVAQGLTQSSLAEKAGVSQNAIYKILNSKTQKSRNLPEIAKALGVSVEELSSPSSIEEVSTAKARLLRKIQNADDASLEDIEKIVDAVLDLRRLKISAGIED